MGLYCYLYFNQTCSTESDIEWCRVLPWCYTYGVKKYTCCGVEKNPSFISHKVMLDRTLGSYGNSLDDLKSWGDLLYHWQGMLVGNITMFLPRNSMDIVFPYPFLFRRLCNLSTMWVYYSVKNMWVDFCLGRWTYCWTSTYHFDSQDVPGSWCFASQQKWMRLQE